MYIFMKEHLVDFIRTWLWRQIDLGSFDNQKAIVGFALSISCRAVILASGLSLATLPLLYGLGFLTMPVEEAIKITVAFSWLFGVRSPVPLPCRRPCHPRSHAIARRVRAPEPHGYAFRSRQSPSVQ